MCPWLFLSVCFLMGMTTTQADAPTVVSSSADYQFGSRLEFTAAVHSGESIRQAFLVAQDDGSAPVRLPVEISFDKDCLLLAVWDLTAAPVFPFSRMEYWWEMETESGTKFASAKQTIEYADDRFTWRELDQGRANLHWIEGSAGDAEDTVNLILLSLGSVSADLATPIPEKIRVYVYPRLADLHAGLGTSVRGWEGAVSDPASATILVAAAPGADGRRSLAILLPHEIVHILLGSKWQPASLHLPDWLVEGLAASYEMDSRPELDHLLKDSLTSGNLIPLSALCRAFPSEESPALLAYAESRSFVSFIRSQYGLEGIRRILDDYDEGSPCQDGVTGFTGKNLDDLEREWINSQTGRNPSSPVPAGVFMAGGVGILLVILLAGWVVRRRRENQTPKGMEL